MGTDYVTPEQINAAREVNLLEYLQRTEPGNVIPSAPGEYKLKDHDSLKISNGKFHWFSRGIGGTNAIDYLVKVKGVDFKEAVKELSDGVSSILYTSEKQEKRPPPETPNKSKPINQPNQNNDRRFFILPEADSHNDDVIEYLKGRGIEEGIIKDCIEKKLLYQSTKQGCVFVGCDKSGVPRFAHERGIKSDHKKDVAGSNKAHGFCMPPKSRDSDKQEVSPRLYVFEGALDCLSHASIADIGGADWDGYRLSLGGVSGLAIHAFLENNPHISEVYLCLDNDKPGQEATNRISNELMANDGYSRINIIIAHVPDGTGKDFNDTLRFMQETRRQRKEVIHERSSGFHDRTGKGRTKGSDPRGI